MHRGGQIKTVPIHRTIHAILKTIHPLTNGNVDFHRRVVWLFTYPRATNPGRTLRLPRVLRLIRPAYISDKILVLLTILFHLRVILFNQFVPICMQNIKKIPGDLKDLCTNWC